MCTTTSGMELLLNKTSVKQARPRGGWKPEISAILDLGQEIFKFNASPGYTANLNPDCATQQGSSKTRESEEG